MPAAKRPGEVDPPYMSLLQEYQRSERRKKRRTAQDFQEKQKQVKIEPDQSIHSTDSGQLSPVPGIHPIHPILDLDSESESDADFEDVNLEDFEDGESHYSATDDQQGDVNISLDPHNARHLTRTKQRALPKPQRLALHKIGLMAWMLHAQLRNRWLSDPLLLNQSVFKHLVPDDILRNIRPKAHLTPFLKSKHLIEGLEELMNSWAGLFQVNRASLASTRTDEAGDRVHSRAEFIKMLISLQGSRDLMSQGFVALIRSIGLTARLVISLQPPDNLGADSTGEAKVSKRSKKGPTESGCPIYWAEVWDPHTNKWIVLDPLTKTLRLPTRNRVKLPIEPPMSDNDNILRYCIAFDNTGYARDVTRRYAFAYNARTRKKRLSHVESEEFLDRLFGIYSKTRFDKYDRDELTELARYPRLEGIPTRVQDFIGHPEYVLEDQLHKNEVLREGAKPSGILAMTSKASRAYKMAALNPKQKYIFSRSDVLMAKSSQSWYRQGREIKLGVQPRTRREHKNRLTGEMESTGLYTFDQTRSFQPQKVSDDGTVPKSQYRTVDMFAPEMIPIGAVHIRSALAANAAKILRIDYANAVTGIEYGKRGAVSKISGIVVARQFAAAVFAVIEGLEVQEEVKRKQANTARIMRLWRQFIMGIQIHERVEAMNPNKSPNNSVESPVRENCVSTDERQNDDKDSQAENDAGELESYVTPERTKRNYKSLIRQSVPLKFAATRSTHHVSSPYPGPTQYKPTPADDEEKIDLTPEEDDLLPPEPASVILYDDLSASSFDEVDAAEISESEL